MAQKKTLEERIRNYIRENENSFWFKLEELLYDLTETIYERMKQKGISQRELAKRLGVSDAYISKILKGNENISLKTLLKLALALGLNVEIKMQPIEQRSYRKNEESTSNRSWQEVIDFPEYKFDENDFQRAA